MKILPLLACLILSPAYAEIILPARAPEPDFYQHPALRSLVFVSLETRQMAILPPPIVFLSPPPLLMRASGSMPPYPPAVYLPGVNRPARPSNRDNGSYNLQRAHSFSPNLYRDNGALYFGLFPYPYNGATYGPSYPLASTPGFNRSAYPSNRDATSYNLERAHRFSMDGYRQP